MLTLNDPDLDNPILQEVIQIWIVFTKPNFLGMAKAGAALKQVLETYQISGNRLAKTMGISYSNIHRWTHEVVDPAGNSILAIRDALEKINPEAAEEFIRLYLDK